MKREIQRFRYKVSINIYKHHKRKQFDGRTETTQITGLISATLTAGLTKVETVWARVVALTQPLFLFA